MSARTTHWRAAHAGNRLGSPLHRALAGMMRSNAPAGAADFDILNPPLALQPQILAILAQLVERLSDRGIAEQVRELAPISKKSG